MRKNILKRIGSVVLIFVLSVTMSLGNAAYSLEPSISSRKNNNSIELNTDVRIEDDFYNAVNKEWLSNTKLENGYVSYGTFEEVCGKVNSDIHNIILDIQKNKDTLDKNSDELKVLNLYNNYLNLDNRNKLGVKPIEKYIDKVNNIKTIKDLKAILGDNEFSYFQPLINLSVGPDYKDSNTNVLYISRSNLGLGNSFYYKDTSEKSEKVKQIYIDYITKLYTLYGEDEKVARKDAEIFYNIENKIAQKIPSSEEEAKDDNRIQKSYNVYTIKELNKLIPNMEISKLLTKLNIKNAKKIIVENPEELKLIDSFVTKDNIDSMKLYLKTSVLLNTDNLLTSEYREASNELRKVFYGVDTIALNEGSGIKFASCQLNEVLSKLYINKYFDKNSKSDVENMAKEIIINFENRIQNISWMSKTTKKEALNKLENVNVKIGYPDKWNDYSDIEINSYDEGGSLIENVINIYMSQIKKQFSKLNEPVNKNEWNMGACTVNAYYNALNNEIVFPAGILQAPFYDKNASKENNLGGIGVIIGHELTHAFDNTGTQFDETGKLKNWWSTNEL